MIGNLEKLLAQEVGKAKATANLAKEYKRLREETHRLKKELADVTGVPQPQMVGAPSDDGAAVKRMEEVGGWRGRTVCEREK